MCITIYKGTLLKRTYTNLCIQKKTSTVYTRVVPKLLRQSLILSKGLNVIQNNLHSYQVLHIWDLGLNYLTASFNGYDPVAFLRLIPPLSRSTSHYINVHSTVSLIYYPLNEQATINSFVSKVHLYQ